MSDSELREKVVDLMLENDHFSKLMKMEVLSLGAGSCEIKMKVRKEMLNGFGIAHGAITYALADSALAFASNGKGKKCVSIDTQISHLYPCKESDVLTATAKEVNRTKSLGHYDIHIENQEKRLIAHFKGTVYIKNELWFPQEEN